MYITCYKGKEQFRPHSRCDAIAGNNRSYCNGWAHTFMYRNYTQKLFFPPFSLFSCLSCMLWVLCYIVHDVHAVHACLDDKSCPNGMSLVL